MTVSQAEQYGRAIAAFHPRQIGALPLLVPILTRLRVQALTNALVPSEADIDPGRIVLLLLLNRLLAPQPLYQVADWLAETVLPEGLGIAPAQVYDNRLGRTLDRLYPYLGELWAQVVSQAIQVYSLDLSVLHWDITSIYFEGAYTDSHLVTYGYSRDQRPDAKQVELEVDVTHDGYVPVLYQSLVGNTADITRPLPHLQALLHFLARPELADRQLRPLLVSDCKLLTSEVVLACHRHQLFYLGPLANSQATQTVLRSVSQAELATCPLAYRPKRVAPDDPTFVPYQGVWRPFTFEHAGEHVTDRVLVVWSAGKQRLDEQKRKTALKRLLNGLAHIQQKLNTRRYKQRTYVEARLTHCRQGNPAQELVTVQLTGTDGALQLHFQLHRERLAQVQALDGRYALATNARHWDASHILTLFKGQDGVEKRFRTVKGPLVVHPLFVRTDRRIEGLLWITLLAVLIRAILEQVSRQQGLDLTADRLLDGFAHLQAVEVHWQDGSRQRQAAGMTPFQQRVLDALGWPTPDAYARLTPFVG